MVETGQRHSGKTNPASRDREGNLVLRVVDLLRPNRNSTPVHFLHIRKTGGTAIAEALGPIAKRHGIVLHDHSTKLRDVPREDRVFFFVRHPVTRFVSGFWSRLRRGLPRHHYEWNDREAEAFSHFQEANCLAEALSSPNQEIALRARQAMGSISHVKSTYRDWFDGVAELDRRSDSIALVGIQEQMVEDFEHLKDVLHLPRSLALPNEDVLAHRTPQEFDRRLSPLAEANLLEWYSEDVRFYEHCVRLRGVMSLHRELAPGR